MGGFDTIQFIPGLLVFMPNLWWHFWIELAILYCIFSRSGCSGHHLWPVITVDVRAMLSLSIQEGWMQYAFVMFSTFRGTFAVQFLTQPFVFMVT